jgi:FkbM family methyltransferase
MNRLIIPLKFIWNHPLASKNRVKAFIKFFRWQLSQMIYPHPVSVPFVENSRLIIERGMKGATGNIYTGLAEFEDMSFLLHVLRKGDTFADIGANVGAYTILASKNAGAITYSFEPVLATFNKLKKNIKANDIAPLVYPMLCGVGAKNGLLFFTKKLDTVNHVVYEKNNTINGEVAEVPVTTLDEIFIDQQPQLIKIDVEGFEWDVLAGAAKTLLSVNLKAIIIELNGSGKRYGFDDKAIHEKLLANSFHPYIYEPFKRKLSQLKTYGNFNTLYIKDIDWVSERIQHAPKFKLFKQEI